MADKITKFEDYKKKENGEDFDIEIVDPYNFFNAEEREEYFRERQKEQQRQRREASIKEAGEIDASQKAASQRPAKEQAPVQKAPAKPVAPAKPASPEKAAPSPEKAAPPRPEKQDRPARPAKPAPAPKPQKKYEPEYDDYEDEYDEEDYEDYKDEYPEDYDDRYDDRYDDDYEDEDYDDDEEDGGNDLMLVVVRVASIITGVIILALLAFALKTKVLDNMLQPDPDEAPVQEAQAALPEGYTETNDIVVVTAETLNLRSVPSSESTETVVAMVPKGDQLKRIAQADDGSWAIVEFEGQKVYAFTKYLATP